MDWCGDAFECMLGLSYYTCVACVAAQASGQTWNLQRYRIGRARWKDL